MTPKSVELKKIMIVCAILLVLVMGAVWLRMQRQSSVGENNQGGKTVVTKPVIPSVTLFETPGMYTITLSDDKVSLGGEVTAELTFFADKKILDGSDVILRFNPQYLAVEEGSLTTGGYFDQYPVKITDNDSGLLKVSGYTLNTHAPMTAPEKFLSVTFRAKKKGATSLSLDFGRGKTEMSTLVESKTSRNLLGKAEKSDLTIE